jgi:hypothetical protein
MDLANANGGCDPKLDRAGAAILGRRSKLLAGYKGTFGDAVASL